MTYCLMHALAMECRRRKGQVEVNPHEPPGLSPPQANRDEHTV